jgi:hypothetical protein
VSTADRVADLLERALHVYRNHPRAVGRLRHELGLFGRPPQLAVIGRAGSGSSTLAAALQALRGAFTVLDAPALDDEITPHAVRRARGDADAVLYLLRRPHGMDVAALRALHSHPIARSAPVSCVAVLSRADEFGAGRVDALISARQLARRYRRTAPLRDWCQDVVAVAGLTATAALTLSEAEFAAIGALAALDREALEPHLLSADRFARPDCPLPLPAGQRAELLTRFGLFGLRLSTTLVRRGANSRADLAGQLLRRSGLEDLHESIEQHLLAHADLLRAQSALVALDMVLRSEPNEAGEQLATELDRILAAAHELQELRLLAALRTGRVHLPEQLLAEAVRLLGGNGADVTLRLAGTEDPTGAAARWQALAANPVLDRTQRRAAAIVARSCEGMAVTRAS